MTQTEIEDKLGYAHTCLGDRVWRLVETGLLQYIVLPSNSSCSKYKLYCGYNGMKIYYVDKKGLARWFEKQFLGFRKAINNRLRRNFGLELVFKIEEIR